MTLPCMEAAYRILWIEIEHKGSKKRIGKNQAIYGQVADQGGDDPGSGMPVSQANAVAHNAIPAINLNPGIIADLQPMVNPN